MSTLIQKICRTIKISMVFHQKKILMGYMNNHFFKNFLIFGYFFEEVIHGPDSLSFYIEIVSKRSSSISDQIDHHQD
jgi:hypothetical protein